MASRSFKPVSASASASHLASQPAKRSPRPSFTRSSSASSSLSGKDAESTGILRTTGGPSPRRHAPVDSTSSYSSLHHSIDDAPGRKPSQPIAIELPPRKQPLYTPLSARGDLPGGYFPFHEAFPKPYKAHLSLRYHQENKDRLEQQQSTSEPASPLFIPSPVMSNASSAIASPAETNPKAPPSLISPAKTASFPGPEVLTMPMGKYHPANYKAPAKPAPKSAASLSPMNISLPPSVPDRKKKSRAGQERYGSEVKRKLQEYQLGQMKQAQMLAQSYGGAGYISEPISPRLLPLGSPGPITPFELEESGESGYIVAGARDRTEALISRGLERDIDRELVGRIIQAEANRRILGGKEGSQSPVLRV